MFSATARPLRARVSNTIMTEQREISLPLLTQSEERRAISIPFARALFYLIYYLYCFRAIIVVSVRQKSSLLCCLNNVVVVVRLQRLES